MQVLGGRGLRAAVAVAGMVVVLTSHPAAARTRANGSFVQSQGQSGQLGRFEVVRLRRGGGVDHQWRNNDVPTTPWSLPKVAFGSFLDVTHVALIEAQDVTGPRLEVIGVEGGKLFFQSRESSGLNHWQTRSELPGDVEVVGMPGFIQAAIGNRMERHVVAPLVSGGMAHWVELQGAPGLTWVGPTVFATDQGVSDVSLIQSNEGSAGTLQLVARVGSSLLWYTNDLSQPRGWSGGDIIAQGVRGSPALIQTRSGRRGDFELVAPLASGGLGSWRRLNGHVSRPWIGPWQFGAGSFDAASLVESEWGPNRRRLEVIARAGEAYVHFWRDGHIRWRGPQTLPTLPLQPPEVGGRSDALMRGGFVGVHSTLLRTGKLLFFGPTESQTPGTGRVFDWQTGIASPTVRNPTVFCSGHSAFPDGRLVAVGGHHNALREVNVFDPDTLQWTLAGMMPKGRWYPGVVTLPDGRVLMMSGSEKGGIVTPTNPLNPTLQWMDSSGAISPEHPLPSPFSTLFPAHVPTVDLYPFLHVLPSGKLFVHSRQTTRFYDPQTNAWDPLELHAVSPHSRSWPLSGSSVLLPLDPSDSPPYRARVLIAGGGTGQPEDASTQTSTTPATATAEILDTSAPNPAWRSTTSMHLPRVLTQSVLLPDGKVLVVGGSLRGRDITAIDPVLEPELFDPENETWTLLNPISVPRLYHSTALLLPDGRVMVAGKDGTYVPHPFHYPEHRVELFSPPNLFQGPRPILTGSPQAFSYGDVIRLESPNAADARVVLIKLASGTHGQDTEQRLVKLETVARANGALEVRAPPDGNIAPPGHYMLFLVSPAGVPSMAHIVSVG